MEPGIITSAPFGMCQCLKGLKDVSTFASGINDMNPMTQRLSILVLLRPWTPQKNHLPNRRPATLDGWIHQREIHNDRLIASEKLDRLRETIPGRFSEWNKCVQIFIFKRISKHNFPVGLENYKGHGTIIFPPHMSAANWSSEWTWVKNNRLTLVLFLA